MGNRLSVTDEQGKITHYTYDNLYQLTKVDCPDGQTVEYTYDSVGNRTSAGGIPYIYDNANRLIQVGVVTYEYDLNGNLISVGEATYYDYDYENRLVLFADETNTIQYTYDGDGNRLGQSVSGSVYCTYEYIYDINTGIPRLLVEKDSAGNTNNYIYAGRLFSRIDSEGKLYYHHEGLGSISVITDVYGQPLNRYTYDAFGGPLSVSENVYNSLRFTGEPYDANGLIYLRARYYDPATGRFLSQDTFKGKLTDPLSQNHYVYCSNNPVPYVDPSGHLTFCEFKNRFLHGVWKTDDEMTEYENFAVFSPAWTYYNILNADLPDEVKQEYFDQYTEEFAMSAALMLGAGGVSKTKGVIPTYWPPNRGFLDTPNVDTLNTGTIIDRYGSPSGRFASPKGTPFKMRSLPPEALVKPYIQYEVVKPIEVNAGKAAPWFGQPGLGTQYEFSKSIQELVDDGILKVVN